MWLSQKRRICFNFQTADAMHAVFEHRSISCEVSVWNVLLAPAGARVQVIILIIIIIIRKIINFLKYVDLKGFKLDSCHQSNVVSFGHIHDICTDPSVFFFFIIIDLKIKVLETRFVIVSKPGLI
jgi:hypothetical protein